MSRLMDLFRKKHFEKEFNGEINEEVFNPEVRIRYIIFT